MVFCHISIINTIINYFIIITAEKFTARQNQKTYREAKPKNLP